MPLWRVAAAVVHAVTRVATISLQDAACHARRGAFVTTVEEGIREDRDDRRECEERLRVHLEVIQDGHERDAADRVAQQRGEDVPAERGAE